MTSMSKKDSSMGDGGVRTSEESQGGGGASQGV